MLNPALSHYLVHQEVTPSDPRKPEARKSFYISVVYVACVCLIQIFKKQCIISST